ncbi:MAG: dienelactone hydrolase family protein [Gammaproteobacteria bacterium]|nr:dienelactone hydrolase family protein [Gammaproteobacteria bacterium]
MSGDKANIHGETVTYDAAGAKMKGYLAYDETQSGKRPGVLVLPEWWGIDDYIRSRARKLAELGFTALAVDMYGDGATADNPDAAGKAMNAILEDMAGAGEARFAAGLDLLSKQPTVDAARIAAIGYCFGGAMVLHAARIGLDLRGVASFHGALGSFHKPAPGGVRAKVLVCHGGADKFVDGDAVKTFKAEMDEAGADYRFVVYDGALHGFTNPHADENGQKFGLPLAYDAAADKKSWRQMQEFFADIFR